MQMAADLRLEIGQAPRRLGSMKRGKEVRVVSLSSEAGYDPISRKTGRNLNFANQDLA
jgi:hypothetical protein